MGRIWMPGGAGGADLDVITAGEGDILSGKVIVGPDGEPLTGTLALTGSAADSQVLSGKTYYNTDPKAKRTGSMPNQGAVAPAGLNAGGSYTIPAGYHNGSGKVTANSLASQTGVQSGKTAAGAGQVLTGYEAWVNGGRVTGTMANQGAQTAGVNCGGTYTIPAGYHNGQGKVTGNSLASQTDATSGAGDILSGKTAWVKGSKLTGTMANKGAVTGSVNCGGSYTIPAGYHNGSGKITGNSLASQTGVQSGKTAAGAGHILTGYEAWVNGGRVTGTMANQGARSSSLNCGGSYTIPAGYHNGSGKVTANSLASQTSANASADQILTGRTAYVNGSKVTGTMADRRTLDSTIGGINSSYPNVSVQKAVSLQFNATTKGIRYGAMTGPTGFYENGAAYVGLPAQSKTITPSASTQTAYADSGKILESVTVNPIPNQKSYGGDVRKILHWSNGYTYFGFDQGYYGTNDPDMGYPSIKAPSQTKTVTPSASTQTVSADSNKVLKSVTVNGCQVFKQYTGHGLLSETPGAHNFTDMNGDKWNLPTLTIPVSSNFVPMGIAVFNNFNASGAGGGVTQDPWHIITFDTKNNKGWWFNYGGGNGITWGGSNNIVVPVPFANVEYCYVLCGYMK